jgi:hypothetical protein
MDLQEMRWGGMDRIYLAQNRDRMRKLVNVVMNLRLKKKWVISSLAEDLEASQEGSLTL